MEVDEKELELLERRLAEKVEARVRNRLVGVYGTILAGVLTVFSLLGIQTWWNFEASVISSAASKAETATLEAIAPQIGDAKKAADEAERSAHASAAQTKAMDNFRRDTQQRLNRTLDNVDDVAAGIEGRLQEIQDTLESAKKDVDSFRERSADLYLSAGYEEIIQDLAANIEELANAVSEIQASDVSSSGDHSVDLAQVQSKVQSTLETVLSRSPRSIKAETTVYFQFAGSTREQAEEISDRLSKDGFVFPGEERRPEAANKAEVRYFFEEDGFRASQLAQDANEVLVSMGLEARLTPRFIQGTKATPRRGVLELWLEPKPAT